EREEEDLGLAQAAESLRERGHGRAHAADEVPDDAGEEARKEDRVLDAPEVEDLDAEERARDRRAEDGGEAGADAAGDGAPAVLVGEPQHVREEARERGPDLRARPLFPDGAAERERDDRREEPQRRAAPLGAARP